MKGPITRTILPQKGEKRNENEDTGALPDRHCAADRRGGVGDSVTFDTVGSWTGAAILAVLLAAGGIVCWGYGRGLEIERAEKAQLRRYCRKLKSCQRAAEEKNDRHSA